MKSIQFELTRGLLRPIFVTSLLVGFSLVFLNH